jgi:hypothetical protein
MLRTQTKIEETGPVIAVMAVRHDGSTVLVDAFQDREGADAVLAETEAALRSALTRAKQTGKAHVVRYESSQFHVHEESDLYAELESRKGMVVGTIVGIVQPDE